MKAYIVIRGEGEYEEYTESIERVFTTCEKATEYIKGMGYTLMNPWGRHSNPINIATRGRIDCEELMLKLQEWQNESLANEYEYINFWQRNVYETNNVDYRIEEHDIDISE